MYIYVFARQQKRRTYSVAALPKDTVVAAVLARPARITCVHIYNIYQVYIYIYIYASGRKKMELFSSVFRLSAQHRQANECRIDCRFVHVFGDILGTILKTTAAPTWRFDP